MNCKNIIGIHVSFCIHLSIKTKQVHITEIMQTALLDKMMMVDYTAN